MSELDNILNHYRDYNPFPTPFIQAPDEWQKQYNLNLNSCLQKSKQQIIDLVKQAKPERGETMYFESYNRAIDRYEANLTKLLGVNL